MPFNPEYIILNNSQEFDSPDRKLAYQYRHFQDFGRKKQTDDLFFRNSNIVGQGVGFIGLNIDNSTGEITINYDGTGDQPPTIFRWLSFTDGTNTTTAESGADILTIEGVDIDVEIDPATKTLTLTGGGGSTQNLWETVRANVGQVTADTPTDTLQIVGQNTIRTSANNDTVFVVGPNLVEGTGITISESGDDYTISATGTQIWSQKPNLDIYYNLGNVGINIDETTVAPEYLFTVGVDTPLTSKATDPISTIVTSTQPKGADGSTSPWGYSKDNQVSGANQGLIFGGGFEDYGSGTLGFQRDTDFINNEAVHLRWDDTADSFVYRVKNDPTKYTLGSTELTQILIDSAIASLGLSIKADKFSGFTDSASDLEITAFTGNPNFLPDVVLVSKRWQVGSPNNQTVGETVEFLRGSMILDPADPTNQTVKFKVRIFQAPGLFLPNAFREVYYIINTA